MAYDIAYQPIKEELEAGDLPIGRVLLIFQFLLVIYRYVYLHMGMCIYMQKRLEVIDDCESPDMGTKNLTHVFYKSSKCP